MHNPTTDSSMNLQNLLPDTALPAASTHTPPPTPKKITNQITETNSIKKSPNPKPTSDNEQYPKVSHRPPAYTSFSTFGLEEPEGPKSLELPKEANPALVSSPPIAMEQIKNALGFEQPQK